MRAELVVDSTAPTRQMCHMAIHNFVLQGWTERNIITLTACASNINAYDVFTKQVGIFFSHHNDHISGRTTFIRTNSDLLLVPRYPSGARGVLASPPIVSGVPGFPQPRSKYIA
jgi:hypothetical protein